MTAFDVKMNKIPDEKILSITIKLRVEHMYISSMSWFITYLSANSFRGNYSFLNLTLCTVTFAHSTYRCGNYLRKYGTWLKCIPTFALLRLHWSEAQIRVCLILELTNTVNGDFFLPHLTAKGLLSKQCSVLAPW